MRESIHELENRGDNTTDLRLILDDAQRLADQAEEAWVRDDYQTAERLIRDAYEEVKRIPAGITVINWWLIGGLIACMVVIAVLASLVIRRRTI